METFTFAFTQRFTREVAQMHIAVKGSVAAPVERMHRQGVTEQRRVAGEHLLQSFFWVPLTKP